MFHIAGVSRSFKHTLMIAAATTIAASTFATFSAMTNANAATGASCILGARTATSAPPGTAKSWAWVKGMQYWSAVCDMKSPALKSLPIAVPMLASPVMGSAIVNYIRTPSHWVACGIVNNGKAWLLATGNDNLNAGWIDASTWVKQTVGTGTPGVMPCNKPLAPGVVGEFPPNSPLAPKLGNTAAWDKVAQCESSGNWAINTGNGYFGGLQFSASTWTGFGGAVYAPTANKATREQQITIARKVLAKQGVKAWPNCGPKAGLKPGD